MVTRWKVKRDTLLGGCIMWFWVWTSKWGQPRDEFSKNCFPKKINKNRDQKRKQKLEQKRSNEIPSSETKVKGGFTRFKRLFTALAKFLWEKEHSRWMSRTKVSRRVTLHRWELVALKETEQWLVSVLWLRRLRHIPRYINYSAPIVINYGHRPENLMLSYYQDRYFMYESNNLLTASTNRRIWSSNIRPIRYLPLRILIRLPRFLGGRGGAEKNSWGKGF